MVIGDQGKTAESQIQELKSGLSEEAGLSEEVVRIDE